MSWKVCFESKKCQQLVKCYLHHRHTHIEGHTRTHKHTHTPLHQKLHSLPCLCRGAFPKNGGCMCNSSFNLISNSSGCLGRSFYIVLINKTNQRHRTLLRQYKPHNSTSRCIKCFLVVTIFCRPSNWCLAILLAYQTVEFRCLLLLVICIYFNPCWISFCG